MSEPRAFERILASLYDAMLDDASWPATSALIDEACGVVGNALLVGEGPPDDIRVTFVGLYYRWQRRHELEREYLELYHPSNEGIPRLRQLPHGPPRGSGSPPSGRCPPRRAPAAGTGVLWPRGRSSRVRPRGAPSRRPARPGVQ